MKPANSLFSSLGTTIFEIMSRLAAESGAVNLGQGSPEGLEPAELVAEAARAAAAGPHQYPPMMGLADLRRAVAAHEARYWGTKTVPESVMVTAGATEALASSLFGLIEPGDEVVLIEPLYDSYLPIVRRAGGIAKLVRLEPPHWHLPRDALAAAFSDATKLVILNSPVNPCGKVFDAAELAFIAGLLERHDCYALCDEVYEHLVYDGGRHLPLAALPGMAERCLKVGSAGKIFSLTGWKVGWVVGPPALLAPVAKAHQYLTCTTPPHLQAAVAWGLDHAGDYVTGLAGLLQPRRDRLARGLAELGFQILPSAGSYFLTADFSALAPHMDDHAFCRMMTTEGKVAAIPVGAFYDKDGPKTQIRFCFAKTDVVLDEALRRLGEWRSVRQVTIKPR